MISTPPGFLAVLSAPEGATPATFVFRGTELLLREDLAVPADHELRGLPIEDETALPVGTFEGRFFRAAMLERDVQPPAGFTFKGLRALFGKLEERTLAIAARAVQLVEWARTHRFCGCCGAPMTRLAGERAMRCACGHTAYPRISPAMMVLVRRGPQILLARNAAVPAGGRMSALAGFLEAGESIEDAIHREVMEEVGLRVRDFRYFASQSWPFPHALMVAFTAEYAGGEVRVDTSEIAEARWFGPGDALPELPPRQSISRALIEANLPLLD
jgi:NAD+ diphosphatase